MTTEIIDKLVNGILVLGGVGLVMGVIVFIITIAFIIWVFIKLRGHL